MVWRRVLDKAEFTPAEARHGFRDRQGFMDRPVLAILVTSVAMVCILFGLLLLGI